MTRRTGRLPTAVTAALALTVAGMVTGLIPAGANHQFSDVATSNVFHGPIDNFVDAGCAIGFPDGTYRPTDPTNRQQIARFINSCGGRVAHNASASSVQLPSSSINTADVAEAQLTAGALAGGGFVAVTATARLFSNSTTPGEYPCEGTFRVHQTGGLTATSARALFLDLNGPVAGSPHASGAITHLIVVEAGATVTVTLRVNESTAPACTADVFATGDVLLEYFPFDGTGEGGGASIPLVPAG